MYQTGEERKDEEGDGMKVDGLEQINWLLVILMIFQLLQLFLLALIAVRLG